ncbi:MAG TPA: Rieske 2Fe-2S domain-containing protein [Acidimicrobiales bacterium]
MKDWPYEAHPTGWYQIAYSAELAAGDVRPVKYFGEDMVLFRTTDGEVGLLDAYCPHLGAHLGHGGIAREGCIQCPWHAWRWGTDGTNVEIPYADRVTNRVSAGPWPVREIDGIVLTWYDALGREPFWEWPGLPEFKDTDGYYPIYPHCAVDVGQRAIKPQSPLENTPDYHHFIYVHGAGEAAEPTLWEEDGHYLHAQSTLRMGVGREVTWLTPDGPITAYIDTEAWGLGLGLARMTFGERIAAHLISCTPIDDEMSQMFSTIGMTREPGDDGDEPTGVARKLVAMQNDQISNDFHIWENQRFVKDPVFVGKEERAYARFRRWTTQFYPDVSAAQGNGSASDRERVSVQS